MTQKNIAISFKTDLLEEVDDEAKKDERTRSSMVRMLIKEALAERGKISDGSWNKK